MSARDRYRIAGALFYVAAVINLIVGYIVIGGVLLLVGSAMFVASRRYG